MSETTDKQQFLGLKGTKIILDNLKGEYSPLEHTHETSDINGYIKPVQSDWLESDITQLSYVNNRPMYDTPYLPFTAVGTLNSSDSSLEYNVPVLIQDLSSKTTAGLKSIVNPTVLCDTNADPSTYFTAYNCIIKLQTYNTSTSVFTSMEYSLNNSSKYTMLDDLNFEYTLSSLKVTFIIDETLLDETNLALYPGRGVYYTSLLNSSTIQYTYVTGGIVNSTVLDDRFIKSDIARKTYVDESVITDYNELSNLPIVPISEITNYGATYELTKSTDTYEMYKIVFSKDFITPNKIFALENNSSKNIWVDVYMLSNDGTETLLSNVSLLLQGVDKKYYTFRVVENANQTTNYYIESLIGNVRYITQCDADWNVLSCKSYSYTYSDQLLYYVNSNSKSESYSPSADTDLSTKKYVDDTVAAVPGQIQSSWTQNDNTQLNFINDRTHYEETVEETYLIADNMEIEYEEGTSVVEKGSYINRDYISLLTDGASTIVIWNDEEYKCNVSVSDSIYIGNQSLYANEFTGEREDTGEPFCFSVSLATGGPCLVYRESDEAETVTCSLEVIVENTVVHQLDKKYLPDLSYSDLSNMPFTPISDVATYNENTGILYLDLTTLEEGIHNFYINKDALTNVVYYTVNSTVVGFLPSKYDLISSITRINNFDYTNNTKYIIKINDSNGLDYFEYIVFDENWSRVDFGTSYGVTSDNVLLLDKDNMFEPEYDGHPTTKKYVDDLAEATKTATINDILNSSYNQIVMTDAINGYEYIVQMQDGSMVSFCKCASIAVTQNPDNMTVTDGTFDSTGMVVTVTCQDGTTREIENYTCELADNIVTISYIELGITYTTTLEVTIEESDNSETTE